MSERSIHSLDPSPYPLETYPLATRSDEQLAAPEVTTAEPRRKAPSRFFFRSNCYLFAVWQLFRKGGFLIVCKSEWGWWPHVMWSPDMCTVYQFEPTEKKRRRLFPPTFYRGYIKKSRL